MEENICILDAFVWSANGKKIGDQKGRNRGPYGSARVQFTECP